MFIVSTPTLVLAQCKAGVVGSFPALNARPESQLDEWLDQITRELASFAAANPTHKIAPFAVNQIVHASNKRLEHDVRLCVKYKAPIVITSLRPPAEVVSAAISSRSINLFVTLTVLTFGLLALYSGLRRRYPKYGSFLGHTRFSNYFMITIYPIQAHHFGWTWERLARRR